MCVCFLRYSASHFMFLHFMHLYVYITVTIFLLKYSVLSSESQTAIPVELYLQLPDQPVQSERLSSSQRGQSIFKATPLPLIEPNFIYQIIQFPTEKRHQQLNWVKCVFVHRVLTLLRAINLTSHDGIAQIHLVSHQMPPTNWGHILPFSLQTILWAYS